MHKIAPFKFAETQLLISAKVMQSGHHEMSVNIGICGMAACCISYVALNKLVYWLQSP